MDNKSNQTISAIWKKYKRTLNLLDKALDDLEKKPNEVIVEKIINVDKPSPQTLDEIAATNEHLRKQINDLMQWKTRGKMYKVENEKLKLDYWGRPKQIPIAEAKPSKKNIQQDDYVKNLTKNKTDNKIK